jgi:hypothetical protein
MKRWVRWNFGIKRRCLRSISEHATPNTSSQTKNTIWGRNKNRPSEKSRRCNKIVQLWNMKHRNVIRFITFQKSVSGKKKKTYVEL